MARRPLAALALASVLAGACALAPSGLPAPASASEPAPESSLRELTPEELENYPFEIEEDPPKVGGLSAGQRYRLNSQRRAATALFARHLGILSLKGDSRDLPAIQRLIDKRVIARSDLQLWQGLGVLFGDILAADFGMEWVSYEDDLGQSSALRWQDTENYVFPVTLFSKRIQFKEPIQVQPLYQSLAAQIAAFQPRQLHQPRQPR